MKRLLLLFVLSLSLVSCSNDDVDDKPVVVTDYYGKWVQTSEGTPFAAADVVKTSELYYELNRDNTFVKTLIFEGKTTKASGTFEVIKNETGSHFLLTFSLESFLISSCTGGLQESLTLDNKGYLNDNAGMCDRYGKYKKVK